MNKTKSLLIDNHINSTKIITITLYNTNLNCNTGFIIDSNMNYKTHIDKMFKNSNFSPYNIIQIR